MADKLKNDFSLYLKPTVYIDSNSNAIIGYYDNICKTIKSDIDKAVALYYAVRDEITYNPYDIDFSENGMKASKTLDFDGINDSIFHPADNSGNKHMEYIKYHGHYHDLPMDEIYQAYCRYYPNMAKYTDQFRDSKNFKNKHF